MTTKDNAEPAKEQRDALQAVREEINHLKAIHLGVDFKSLLEKVESVERALAADIFGRPQETPTPSETGFQEVSGPVPVNET